jgi:hypothetical protein
MRQILIGVTLALAYASFAIPIVGGFISVPFFATAGILTWRRDRAMPPPKPKPVVSRVPPRYCRHGCYDPRGMGWCHSAYCPSGEHVHYPSY